MNQLLNGLKQNSNIKTTENGAITRKTTGSSVYDMFAQGAAMRNRSNNDILLMFKKAYEEDPVYALKCLFYLRDIRGGQGERRFFRICLAWLATNHTEVMLHLYKFIPEFGRWDDLYCLFDTPVEKEVVDFIRDQLSLDAECQTPSLLAKWLKSENTSSKESRALARKTREALGLTSKSYRQILSYLREKINIVEKLMSENRWEEIEFDKLPSKAGLKYRNAFARRDILKEKYSSFAQSKDTTVNAGTLYPYEVVKTALQNHFLSEDDRAMINKYWDNLTDYFNNADFNALCVVDTSASMRGTPLNVAISLGMYCAERGKGPFANHYIAFSRNPRLVEIEGIDFCDKVKRIYNANLCENTNLEKTFDMILNTLIQNNCKKEDLPQNLIIISDMEFDTARNDYYSETSTLMENIEQKWLEAGYIMPHLIYWNVDARHDNIPMKDKDGVSFVSGFSPVLFESIMSGKTSIDLMYDKLNSERYKDIV